MTCTRKLSRQSSVSPACPGALLNCYLCYSGCTYTIDFEVVFHTRSASDGLTLKPRSSPITQYISKHIILFPDALISICEDLEKTTVISAHLCHPEDFVQRFVLSRSDQHVVGVVEKYPPRVSMASAPYRYVASRETQRQQSIINTQLLETAATITICDQQLELKWTSICNYPSSSSIDIRPIN